MSKDIHLEQSYSSLCFYLSITYTPFLPLQHSPHLSPLSISFLEDIFEDGEIGGHCEFHAKRHHDNGDHKSPLQSWYVVYSPVCVCVCGTVCGGVWYVLGYTCRYAELEKYTSLDFKINDKNCDEIVEKPTIFIKLDAGTYMYMYTV